MVNWCAAVPSGLKISLLGGERDAVGTSCTASIDADLKITVIHAEVEFFGDEDDIEPFMLLYVSLTHIAIGNP